MDGLIETIRTTSYNSSVFDYDTFELDLDKIYSQFPLFPCVAELSDYHNRMYTLSQKIDPYYSPRVTVDGMTKRQFCDNLEKMCDKVIDKYSNGQEKRRLMLRHTLLPIYKILDGIRRNLH